MPKPPLDETAKDRARSSRKDPSRAEKVLWAWLRNRRTGYKFRRQHSEGPYILDFYCEEARLCVEADGEQHFLRIEEDERRDRFLDSIGIETLRIPNRELLGIGLETPMQLWEEIIRKRCEERVRALAGR